MNLLKPSIEFLWMTDRSLERIEQAGRTCYKSESLITADSAGKFVKKLIDNGHEAMIEHVSMSYKVICDRGVTHEIVRHRLFSYAQESTRYCNYKNGVTFIIPCWINNLEVGNYDESKVESLELSEDLTSCDKIWLRFMINSELDYCYLISKGNELKKNWIPQQARTVLPNSLKTEIVITGNVREWRHFYKLRTAKTAHPQMQEIANMLLKDACEKVPILFDEFKHE